MNNVFYALGLALFASVLVFLLTRKGDQKKLEAAKEVSDHDLRTKKSSASLTAQDQVHGKTRSSGNAAQHLRRDVPVSIPPLPPKDLSGLKKGLTSTRTGLVDRLSALLSGKREIDPAIVSQLEEILLTSDVGPKTTQVLLHRIQERLPKKQLIELDTVFAALKEEACRILLQTPNTPLHVSAKPSIILMVGVNGAGKTTTIGKLATHFTQGGKKVMLGAGDTFRAAAVQQLEVWGNRVQAVVYSGKEGADPGAVAFEATTKAQELGIDVLMIDTAGRLHTKAPLMDEIKKVRRTIEKALAGAPHETLLVLDATTGQNALNQAALFKEAIPLTGIILTKLDGTAKGGIVLAIAEELSLPVRYIGLGERAEDLREFHAEDFVDALFTRTPEPN
jgi:fused signal recognition particle receptor